MIFNRFRRPDERAGLARVLAHAGGEILLVVVGILIAVQIDGWVEDRRDAKAAARSLERIEQDLRTDSEALRARIDDLEVGFRAIDSVRAVLEGRSDDSELLERRFSDALTGTFSLTPETSTFQELRESGEFRVLDEDVGVALIRYYNFWENDVQPWNDALVEYSRRTIGPHLWARYPVSYFDRSDDGLLVPTEDQVPIRDLDLAAIRDDLLVSNALRFRLYLTTSLEGIYRDALEQIEELSALIEAEG